MCHKDFGINKSKWKLHIKKEHNGLAADFVQALKKITEDAPEETGEAQKQQPYLEASGQELESRRVCGLLVYLYEKVDKKVPEWVKNGADDYYGNLNRLDEATKMLCEACRSLTEEETEKYIYDAHDKTARKLANWFERHQEWDERRVKEEEESRRKIMLKDRALKKLTLSERQALGL